MDEIAVISASSGKIYKFSLQRKTMSHYLHEKSLRANGLLTTW